MKKNGVIRALSYVLLVVIVLSFFVVQFSRLLQIELTKNTTSTLKEISEQSASIINNNVTYELQLLTEIASSISVSTSESFDLDAVIKTLEYHRANLTFKALGLIFKDGSTYNSEGLGISMPPEIMEVYDPVFAGDTLVSDRIADETDGKDIMVYAVPIYIGDSPEIILFSAYDMEDFKVMLAIETFGDNGYSYIVKRNGDKVVGSTHSRSFRPFTNIFSDVENASPANKKCVTKMRTDFENGESGMVDFYNKERKYLRYTPLDINDWYMLCVVPTNIVDESANRILLYSLGISAIAVLLVLFATVYLIRAHNKTNKECENFINVDAVTGGMSYARFVLATSEYMAKQTGTVAFMALTIDTIDILYDRYGSDKVDEILCFFSDSIRSIMGEGTLVARQTSKEFFALTPYVSEPSMLARLYALENKVSIPPEELLQNVMLHPTIGIYLVEDRELDIMRMQNAATIAKNAAKKKPGVFFTFYDEFLQNTLQAKKQLADEMVIALKQNEFVPYFQPKYDTKTQKIIGAEALVRWRKPNGEVVMPASFIPLAEENGFIVQIDTEMFRMVCIKQRELLDANITPVPISINLSRKMLYNPSFIDDFALTMSNYGVPRNLIELEMTESTVFSNKAELLRTTEKIRAHGFKILVDDFGTGYSSLMMLKSTYVDAIKLDKSFIDGYEDKSGAQIITSVFALAKKLGLPITAEGVETKSQYEFLREMDCDIIQGYYFAKPMQYEAFVACLPGGADEPT